MKRKKQIKLIELRTCVIQKPLRIRPFVSEQLEVFELLQLSEQIFGYMAKNNNPTI
jgi:hypothetical protein